MTEKLLTGTLSLNTNKQTKQDIQCVCGWMSGIFSGINKFDLQSSSATKSNLKLWAFLLAFSVNSIGN